LAGDPRCEWTFCGDVADREGEGIEPAKLGTSIRFRRLRTRVVRRNLLWQSGACGIALSRDFDTLVLLGNPKHLAMWPAAILGRLTGKRVLFWTHGWTYRPHGALRLLRRWFYRLGHGLLTYGHWAKSIGIDEGFAPGSIHVIGNSLDFEAQSEVWRSLPSDNRECVRRELFGEVDVPVVAWVGRLVAVKELPLLLDAVSILAARGLRANVVMVGDGPERAALAALAERLGVRIRFEGACYDESRIGAIVSAANATASPGPVGLTALHSLAFGTPVVSHSDPERQMPEHEAIIPGRTGSLFERGSAESLADALEPWLRRPLPSDETREACRAPVRRLWSPGYQVEALVRAVEGRPADEVSLAWDRANPR